MTLMTVTPEIAFAAGRDAANRQMKAAGRTKWNRDDSALACETNARLMLKYGDRYQQMAAESALQRMGIGESIQAAAKDHVRNSALASIYADAAAWLERNPSSAASDAISVVTKRLSFRTSSEANIVFRENFGCWIGNDEGVLMLCFASEIARAGELDYLG